MSAHGLRDAAEDDALGGQALTERGLHADRVHNGIHSRATEGQPLFQRDAQLVEGAHQLRVDVISARGPLLLRRRRVGIIGDSLIVNLRHVEMRPCGLRHLLPDVKGIETELQQPCRLVLLVRDETHGVLSEATFDDVRIYVATKTVGVTLIRYRADVIVVCHERHGRWPQLKDTGYARS